MSLGSGTSGGTLAPLFTIGGGVGGAAGRRASRRSLPALGRRSADRGAGRHGGHLRRRVAGDAGLGRVRVRNDAAAVGLLPLLGGCAAAYLDFLAADAELDHDREDRPPRHAHAARNTWPTRSTRCWSATWPRRTSSRCTRERDARRGARWLSTSNVETTRTRAFRCVDADGVLGGRASRGATCSTSTLPEARKRGRRRAAAGEVRLRRLHRPPGRRPHGQPRHRPAAGRQPRNAARALVGIITRSDVLSVFQHRTREAELQSPTLRLRRGKRGGGNGQPPAVGRKEAD